ncbi:MAG: restriction endonuclease, partial [Aliarcobacter sp.]|nr:restriction endonuclease [Aliarcobacter sp.]
MAKAGTDYERFVLTIQQAILNSEEFSKQKNIKIELNKKIVDNTGTEREFDLYWEYQLAGITYKTIIECKDYNSRISVEKIDALIGKIKDLPDIKPVFATKTGYQSGAETKAKHNKIDLLIVREQIEDDWKDKNGNPFIKKIFIRLIALPA